jgi:ABC-type multidrug transport system fused ATPase/permease subunit
VPQGECTVLMIYRRLLTILDPHERRRFWMLCFMILIMGTLELIGTASILPFLAVISNESMIQENKILHYLYEFFNFSSSDNFLVFLAICTSILILFGQLFKSLTIYALTRYSRMREYSIGKRLLTSYLHRPYDWFLNQNSADLGKNILSEVERVTNGVLVPALRVLAFGTIVTMMAFLLVITEPLAALGGVVIVGGGYVFFFMMSRRYLSRIGGERIHANTARFQAAQEALGGVKDVKLMGLEESYLRRFRRPSMLFAHYQAMAEIIREVPRFMLEAIVFGAMMAFLVILLITAEDGVDEALPVIGMFALAGAKLFPAAQNVYRAMGNLRYGMPALDNLLAEFDTRTTRRSRGSLIEGDDSAIRLRRRLEFVDVAYAYPEATRPALCGLSLDVRANTTVGLVGPSGAGKTTAVDVLLGLLSPQSGEVRIDGTVLDASNVRAWQNRLGYVPQQIFLIDDSIAANIALGCTDEEIDMAAVERAARVADLHDFVVQDLPDGYRTDVGERGVRLSGGQRQRIGIARALYHDPDVLILDEATSALDNLTERAVMDAVHNLGHAKTIVIIAHRLSTVRNCDKIFMLEHGRCTAAGDYDDLFEQHERFRELAAAAT